MKSNKKGRFIFCEKLRKKTTTTSDTNTVPLLGFISLSLFVSIMILNLYDMTLNYKALQLLSRLIKCESYNNFFLDKDEAEKQLGSFGKFTALAGCFDSHSCELKLRNKSQRDMLLLENKRLLNESYTTLTMICISLINNSTFLICAF